MKTIILALVTVLAVSSTLFAQKKGVGTLYGTRDPLACPTQKEPLKGGPSADQAAQYLRCGREGVSASSARNSLTLYENVRLEVGKGRSYQNSDSLLHDIDPSMPVYAIRGTFDLYSCADPKRMTPPKPGRNCNLNVSVPGTGTCYRTSFGDWKCDMGYDFDFRKTQRDVPGPQ